jgi:WD40 repeat protein
LFGGLLIIGLWLVPARAGSILISDFVNNTVTEYDAVTGAYQTTLVTSGSGGLNGASGIRVGPDGNIYVTSQFTNTVARFSGITGAYVGDFVMAGAGGLNSPQDLLFGPDGNLWVVSSANDEIIRYNGRTGAPLGVFATVDQPSHNGPINLLFGPDGNLYVSAFDGSRILKLNGATGALIGTMLPPAGSSPAFVGLVFGPDGDLYASAIDTTTFVGSVVRYDPSTLALLGTFVANGTGGLISPTALAFDTAGNLEVLDPANTGILEFSGTGAFVSQLVSDPTNLNTPLFFTTINVPEPAALSMVVVGLAFCWVRSRLVSRPR